MIRLHTALLFVVAIGLFVATPALAEKESAKSDGGDWISLIPEDSLDGWETKNRDKYWQLKDGMIIGENVDQEESRLWTKNDYCNYELVVEYMTPSKDYDSGIFLRGTSHQAQIGISRSLKKDLTGCLYCPKDGNGKYPQTPYDRVKKMHKLGEWNELRIITKGKQITTFLNGEMINNYKAVKYPEKGKLGLQLHGKVHQKMVFRTIKIRPVKGD